MLVKDKTKCTTEHDWLKDTIKQTNARWHHKTNEWINNQNGGMSYQVFQLKITQWTKISPLVERCSDWTFECDQNPSA